MGTHRPVCLWVCFGLDTLQRWHIHARYATPDPAIAKAKELLAKKQAWPISALQVTATEAGKDELYRAVREGWPSPFPLLDSKLTVERVT